MEKHDSAAAFIGRVSGMINNNEKKSRLKQAVGDDKDEWLSANSVVGSAMPGLEFPWKSQCYATVACLLAQTGDGRHFSGNFGASFKSFCEARLSKQAGDRRFEFLLTSESDVLFVRLRGLVRMLQQQGTRINWVRLLEDVVAWNDDNKKIQQRWSYSYYAGVSEE